MSAREFLAHGQDEDRKTDTHTHTQGGREGERARQGMELEILLSDLVDSEWI
jgi:hypothetical protein